ncbi:MAG: hypothetical protein AB8B51_10090 [Sedimentitalea sp.]
MGAMVLALLENADKVALSLRQVFQSGWQKMLVLAALFVLLKLVHEFGHSLAYQTMCRHENLDPGPIRMGLSIFAFTPFPFTDVTGAWRLRSRWRRMMIGAGGMYFELWAVGLLTLFWAQTQSGMVQTLVLQIAVIAGLLTLAFNLNPAVKLDGYFILTDYLRRPNLSGRASIAARNFVARAMGATIPPPNRFDLSYWVVSYLYRWTIFAGIFWLIYQFDKRLGPLAVIIVVMTLVVRPALVTLRHAYGAGIRPVRSAVVGLALVGLGAAFMVPFPDRVLLSGQMLRHETQFIAPPEQARLITVDESGITLDQPALAQQLTDLDLRRSMLENLRRANTNVASEEARLGAELAGLDQTATQLAQRQAGLIIAPDPGAVWTLIQAETLRGSWVGPAKMAQLAAVSRPTEPRLRLRMAQNLIERDMNVASGRTVAVRAAHAPDCGFEAVISRASDGRSVSKETLLIDADLVAPVPPAWMI